MTVWEPILPTDWSPPSTWALRRLGDRRVQQYWDPDHVVARRLAADARDPQPAHECCEQSGVLWDLAALYPAGAVWHDRMPAATVFSGPVIDILEPLEAAVTRRP